jgi:hypothetical protein
MPDSPTTQRWKRLFNKNCAHWPDDQKIRYLNIPNDREDIDEVELESAIELITQINGKPPQE